MPTTSPAILSSLPPRPLLVVGGGILVEREHEVQSYLVRHPDMVGVTNDICQAARLLFESAAALTLQIYHDPESLDEYLMLRVRLPNYPPDTLQRLRSVTEPFENELCAKTGSILVTTDFRPLR